MAQRGHEVSGEFLELGGLGEVLGGIEEFLEEQVVFLLVDHVAGIYVGGQDLVGRLGVGVPAAFSDRLFYRVGLVRRLQFVVLEEVLEETEAFQVEEEEHGEERAPLSEVVLFLDGVDSFEMEAR